MAQAVVLRCLQLLNERVPLGQDLAVLAKKSGSLQGTEPDQKQKVWYDLLNHFSQVSTTFLATYREP